MSAPPRMRRSPGTSARATSKTTATVAPESSRLHRPQDGYAAPTAEDRAVAQAVAVLVRHGYGIALRCRDCGHPITAPASLARLRGPRCAARAVGQ